MRYIWWFMMQRSYFDRHVLKFRREKICFSFIHFSILTQTYDECILFFSSLQFYKSCINSDFFPCYVEISCGDERKCLCNIPPIDLCVSLRIIIFNGWSNLYWKSFKNLLRLIIMCLHVWKIVCKQSIAIFELPLFLFLFITQYLIHVSMFLKLIFNMGFYSCLIYITILWTGVK